MKLLDFRTSEFLNALKMQMGIARDQYGDLATTITIDPLSEFDLEQKLGSAEGLEIDSLDDLKILADHTLTYKGRRVLLYIRDIATYGDREANPRFHVAHCAKLREMKQQGRFNRYVISTRLDGQFTVNLIGHAKRSARVQSLSVCQMCLGKLQYGGFSMDMQRQNRKAAVSRFTLQEFFSKYHISPHAVTPSYDSENAPINDYNRTFPELSRRLRESASYRCQDQSCGLDLSTKSYRKYLDVHHRNAIKNDDRAENLAILCVRCHSEQPYHAHMKSTPRYHEFQRLFPVR